MDNSEQGDDIQLMETSDFPSQISNDMTEENLASVQKFVAVCVTVLMICSMIYIGTILFGGDGFVTYRPGDQALESQEIYSDLIDFGGIKLNGNGVTVCIVDSGIMPEHVDIEDAEIVMWKDFVQNRAKPYDDHGHGTSMAGILIADGWMKGIAPKVNLLVAKALSEDGTGDDGVVAEAIDWCVTNGADIISLSLGGAPDILPLNIGSGRGSDDASADAIDQGVFRYRCCRKRRR